MKKIVSCCGVVCSECSSFPNECKGCPEIKGKAYWLEYTGGEVCEIYNCCVTEKKMNHCGGCEKVPCVFYQMADPTKSEEENAQILKNQMEQLRNRTDK